MPTLSSFVQRFAATTLLLALAPLAAFAAPADDVRAANAAANAGRYADACRSLRRMDIATNGFRTLDDGLLSALRASSSHRSLDFQKAGYAWDAKGNAAQACYDFYYAALLGRAEGLGPAADNLVTLGGRESQAVRTTAAAAPARSARAAGSAASASASAGRIPNGTYECYSATTARFLAGGGAALEPGQWHGRITISGDTYKYGEEPVGRYTMDAHGTLHWHGGGYTEGKTLGRYAALNGTPTIAIGWPGVDVGNACTKR